MPVSGLIIVASCLLCLLAGVVLGYCWRGHGAEEWLEHEIFERDLIIDGLSDELYLLHENPKEFKRRMETAAAVGCSFRGDYGRLVDLPVHPVGHGSEDLA
jgi:hypothetical protein